jgi:ketosteroid isomerase-like protein
MHMKLLLLPLLLAPLPALAQTTQSAPMTKGTGLPPPASEEGAVIATITAIFAALEAGDRAALLAHVYPDGRVTAVGGGKVTQRSFTQFAERLGPDFKFKERIWSPAVEIDGDIAMVWAPYDVRVDGKLSNCGYDLFDLVRENGTWKVMNITFSSRTAGCEAQ